MAEATDVEAALGSGRLKASWDYWQSKRAGRSMPARADLDPPLEIPRLLPWIILTDVLLRDPLDFRYRLIGTAIRDRIAGNYTGMRLMELPHQRPGSRIWDTRSECVRTKAPVLDNQLPYVGPSDLVRAVRHLHLPLSDDGRSVTMILTAVEFDE